MGYIRARNPETGETYDASTGGGQDQYGISGSFNGGPTITAFPTGGGGSANVGVGISGPVNPMMGIAAQRYQGGGVSGGDQEAITAQKYLLENAMRNYQPGFTPLQQGDRNLPAQFQGRGGRGGVFTVDPTTGAINRLPKTQQQMMEDQAQGASERASDEARGYFVNGVRQPWPGAGVPGKTSYGVTPPPPPAGVGTGGAYGGGYGSAAGAYGGASNPNAMIDFNANRSQRLLADRQALEEKAISEDYQRRGMTQSGLLNEAYQRSRKDYGTAQTDIELQRNALLAQEGYRNQGLMQNALQMLGGGYGRGGRGGGGSSAADRGAAIDAFRQQQQMESYAPGVARELAPLQARMGGLNVLEQIAKQRAGEEETQFKRGMEENKFGLDVRKYYSDLTQKMKEADTAAEKEQYKRQRDQVEDIFKGLSESRQEARQNAEERRAEGRYQREETQFGGTPAIPKTDAQLVNDIWNSPAYSDISDRASAWGALSSMPRQRLEEAAAHAGVSTVSSPRIPGEFEQKFGQYQIGLAREQERTNQERSLAQVAVNNPVVLNALGITQNEAQRISWTPALLNMAMDSANKTSEGINRAIKEVIPTLAQISGGFRKIGEFQDRQKYPNPDSPEYVAMVRAEIQALGRRINELKSVAPDLYKEQNDLFVQMLAPATPAVSSKSSIQSMQGP